MPQMAPALWLALLGSASLTIMLIKSLTYYTNNVDKTTSLSSKTTLTLSKNWEL